MRVSVIQLAYTDSESMADRIHRVAGLIEAQDADLIVLPELWSAGGFDYRAWEEKAQNLEGSVAQMLAEAAANTGAYVHGGSIVERSAEPGPQGRYLWNTSLLFNPDGELVETYRKIHRFGFGVGEPNLMEAGEDIVVTDLQLPGAPVEDAGEDHIEFETVKTGLSTCYDLRFPELYRRQVDAGAKMFIIPAAWPSARVSAWRLLLQARAIENQAYVIACNTAGTHVGHEMGGYSAIIAPSGEVLAEAGRGERVISADLDLAAVDELRETFPVLTDRRL